MKRGFGKGFVSGVLVVSLAVGLGMTAMAATRTIQVEDDIQVTLNGARFQPKDANGNEVPLFSYNGTTYLPIRAIGELGPNPEITRFKGLGEISPDEFRHFIGKDMRLEPVTLRKTDSVKEMLEFYMGKNTMERQNFIIHNLVIEEDLVQED